MSAPEPGAGPAAESLAERYGRGSPRTAERPMAFTFGEFARGAGMAWLAFQLAFPLVYALIVFVGGVVDPSSSDPLSSSIGFGFYAVFVTFLYQTPWTLGALVFGGILAWLLGLALQRVPAFGWHLAAFAALGALIGVVASWSAFGALGGGAFVVQLPAVAVSAAAVAFGWWWTARRALRADAAATVGLGHAR
ncbi:hypothetical protein [Agromyces soli]|uniref:Uncharacterized protein n=1 Tax=Agromyces soli TaxID=659012 RepID=A0ABY4AWP1_9MICO|nr:hypothetical protein [Agromyces soli]UOE26827.1 hypothetical protein MTP13_03330 [Agromyces soli]